MHLVIYALFEFNWNESAESDVNNTLQIKAYKWRKNSKVILIFRFPAE